jgi:hypothetical protein
MKNKEMRVIKDGNEWCFVLSNFENLQTSPAIFTDNYAMESLCEMLDIVYNDLKEQKKEI